MKKLKKFFLFFLVILTIQTAYITLNTQVASTNDIFKLTNNSDYIVKEENVLSSKKELIIATEINSPKTNPSKESTKIKINMGALITASVLFPGAALLKIAYCLNSHGISFENWILLLWLLAIIDFFFDKLPVFTSVYQFLQYPMIWITVYLALGHLDDNNTISILQNQFFIYPVVTVFQILKQALIAFITTATFGCFGCGLAGASLLVNIIAFIFFVQLIC
jgi:hypothetical protein